MDTDFHQVTATDTPRSKTRGAGKSISIGRDTWIGAGAFILKGVTIGDNSVVGAGAVVSQDVPPNVIVAGNPAQIVRRLSEPASPAEAPLPENRQEEPDSPLDSIQQASSS